MQLKTLILNAFLIISTLFQIYLNLLRTKIDQCRTIKGRLIFSYMGSC